MAKIQKAAFNFQKFKVPRFSFVDNGKTETKVGLDFKPSGIYDKETGEFYIILKFEAFDEENKEKFLEIESHSLFKFQEALEIENIPDYFYPNSIAILFPYLRAFVSNLTLQANVGVMMLGLINFSSLGPVLRDHTVAKTA